MRSFSSRVIDAPGDCSPSRKVVSKMMSLSDMKELLESRETRSAERQQNKRPAAGAYGPVWVVRVRY
jgi:hypothetical protein